MKHKLFRRLTRLRHHISQFRNRHFLLLDLAIFCLSPLLALGLRLDGEITFPEYALGLLQVTLLFLIIKLAVLYCVGFYKRCWRYASIDELQQIAALMMMVAILQTVFFKALYSLNLGAIHTLPRSLPLLDALVSILGVGGLRFSVRICDRLNRRSERGGQWCDRVLIVGAGNAGIALAQEMQRNPQLGLRPVAFIDDDPAKLNLRMGRLSVVGNRYKIPDYVYSLRIRRVIIAMPSISGQVIREIIDICQSEYRPVRYRGSRKCWEGASA
jgi:FlaA1/EpsC-like NDP-sugar epimerase